MIHRSCILTNDALGVIIKLTKRRIIMKKIISLILSLVMLLGLCSSCKVEPISESFEFKNSSEFWKILKTKVNFYDEDVDYHLYKWGDNAPTEARIVVWIGESSIKYRAFNNISMTLNLKDDKFGDLTMIVNYFKEDERDFSNYEDGRDFSNYQDYTSGGYQFKYLDENYSTTVSNYRAYYKDGPWSVTFFQRVYKTSVAGQNNYSVEDFLSHIPSILASKYKL